MMKTAVIGLLLSTLAWAADEGPIVDVGCTIRTNGKNLDCIIMGKERRVMNPENIGEFLNAGETYITVTSKMGVKRLYKIDKNATQYKDYEKVRDEGSITQISNAKMSLFEAVEKKLVQLSDFQDEKDSKAELVIYDPGRTYTGMLNQKRALAAELQAYMTGKESGCAKSPEFEKAQDTNDKLTSTLSNMISAFHSQGTCLSDFKVFKSRNGRVDLSQLDVLPGQFKQNCRIQK